MFQADASKFKEALEYVEKAKILFNECKVQIESDDVNVAEYASLKDNIQSCNFSPLIDRIQTTKNSLMSLDSEFAREYISLLEQSLAPIDVSNMTDQQLAQYNLEMSINAREYNSVVIGVLEKYEGTGMLTPELEAELKFRRTLDSQYEIKDKMSSLNPESQEYIDLFKQNAELERELIMLNPSISDEDKEKYLAEFDASYNASYDFLTLNLQIKNKTSELEGLEEGSVAYYEKQIEIFQIQVDYLEGKGPLNEEEQKQLDSLKGNIELNQLYIDKEENNGFWHPFVEGELDEAILDKKIELKIASDDEIAYDKMNGWERAWEDTKTFTTSTVIGIGSVVENIVDGGVMLAGGVGSIFGADTKWAEDFVSIHYADDAYSGLVQSGTLNSVSAYSGWHTVGDFLGSTVATIGLQFLPGGNITLFATHALKGVGSEAEEALDEDASFHTALFSGLGAGVIEGASAIFLYGKSSKTGKMIDKAGNFLTNSFGKIPVISKIASKVNHGFNMIATTGMKNYAKAVFKPSLLTRFVVAGGKEYSKELVSMIRDGEYDFKEATNEALKSMATTAFNEFIVSPAINKITNLKGINKKVENANQQESRITRKLNRKRRQLESIMRSEKEAAKSETGQLRSYKANNSTYSSTLDVESYTPNTSALLKSIDRYTSKLNECYSDISLWDELVNSSFVNKFAKKVGSEFMDRGVFTEK